MEELGSLPKFLCKSIDPNQLSVSWTRWLRSFNYYIVGRGTTDAGQKKALLLHFAGPDTQDIYDTLGPHPAEVAADDDFEKAVKRLNGHFCPKRNVAYERHVFRKIKQESSETFDQFLTKLRQQAVYCEFGIGEDDQIRDQIIDQCQSSHLRRKLLEKGNVTLAEVIKIAKADEITEFQVKKFDTSNEYTVARVQNKPASRSNYQTARNQSRPQNKSRDDRKCFRCAKEGHLAKDPMCPAAKATCRKCGFQGHFATCCKTKDQRQKRIHNVEVERNDENDKFAFHIDGLASASCWINQKVPLKMLIDTGSSSNILDKETWEMLKQHKISCKSWVSNEKLYPYGNAAPLNVIGHFRTDISHEDRNCEAEFIVFEGKGKPLMSLDLAEKLGILTLSVNTVCVEDKKPFPKLKGEPTKLHIDPSVTPVSQAPRRVPFSMLKKVEAKIQELLDLDIIEEVKGPTTWVSPVVIVNKPDKDIRLCIDMRQANKAIIREVFQIPVIDEVLEKINGSKWFGKVDLKWGYHQLELEEKSRDITTFAVHCGTYRYKRLMFGISSAPEVYQKTIRNVIRDCEGTTNIADDILVYADSESDLDSRMEKLLGTLRSHGLAINKEKSIFKARELTFMGHKLSPRGVQPTEAKTAAIREAREPTTVSEVRSFMGLVNFCGRYIPGLATIAEPLMALTRKNASFVWTDRQRQAFEEIKDKICKAETLAYFDLEKKTLICDAGPVGLGAILMQEEEGQRRVISFASRALTAVERRYSQTEKEALSVVWACERFHNYLLGIEFTLETDHKPLLYIYNRVNRLSARVERWLLRLQPYKFNLQHVKGTENIADSLSRLISASNTEFENSEMEFHVHHIASEATPRALTTREIEQASYKDSELTTIRECISSDRWENCPKAYKGCRYELSTYGKLVLRGTRLVIPSELRRRILELAHEGHQGVVKTKQNLRSKVWWPGMDAETEKLVKTCRPCQLVTPAYHDEPVQSTKLPNGPWMELAADFMGPLPNGDYLFVVVDYFSRYFEVEIMRETTSSNTIASLRKMFARFGLPQGLRTDNGPQFVAREFKEFLSSNAITHRINTPLWPRANGEVERQNKTILKTLKIAKLEGKDMETELQNFLMAYRTTPHATTGETPAKLLLGYEIRTKIPNVIDTSPDIYQHVRDRDAERKVGQEDYREMTNRSKPEMEVGDTVLLQQRKVTKLTPRYADEDFVITDKNGSQVTVTSKETGNTYTRNASHVKPISMRNEADLRAMEHTNGECEDEVDQRRENSTNSESVNIRRSSRTKEMPKHLKEYVFH